MADEDDEPDYFWLALERMAERTPKLFESGVQVRVPPTRDKEKKQKAMK